MKMEIVNMSANKIIIFGDIHGRTAWKDVVMNEKWDAVVFLGDYVSTHENISSQTQIDNLIDIMEFKEKYPDKVFLLRGNHDTQHLGYEWAECSNLDTRVMKYMSEPVFKERFLKNTQWLYKYKNYIMSHAGISTEWMRFYNIGSIDDINNIEPSRVFGFTPSTMFDMGGFSNTQPLTWIRPVQLFQFAVDGYNQIVGHTPLLVVESLLNKTHACKISKSEEIFKIWFNDDMPNSYIVLTDDNNNIQIERKNI